MLAESRSRRCSWPKSSTIVTSKYGHLDGAGQVACGPESLAHFLTHRIGSVNASYQEIVMASQLKGRKVAFLATDGVEQVELTAPWNALKRAAARRALCAVRHLERH